MTDALKVNLKKNSDSANSNSTQNDSIEKRWHSIVSNFSSTRNLFFSSISTRLKLFYLEVDEFNNFVLKKIITLLALLFFGISFLFSLNIAIIIYFWDTHRTEAAWSIVAFLLLSIIALIVYFIQTNKNPPIFHETLEQLKKDIGSL